MSKTSRAEIERRKTAWANSERERNELEKNKIADNVMGPLPPAKAFLFGRLKGISPDKCDDILKKAMVDLLAGDIPLDPEPQVRRWISDVLRGRTNQQQKLTEDHAFLSVIYDRKHHLYYDRGLTMEEADEMIAKERGKDVETLRKEMQRARQRLRKAGREVPIMKPRQCSIFEAVALGGRKGGTNV
jgi:hypothetical protein